MRAIISIILALAFVTPALAEYEVLHNEYGNMKLTGYVQPRYDYVFPVDKANATDPDFMPESNFDIIRAFVIVKGDVFEYADYMVGFMPNTAADPLFDAWIRMKAPYVNITMGQFKTPFGLELLQSSAKILTIDRSIGTGDCCPGYDTGVMLDSKLPFGDYAWVKPAVAIVNGSGRNTNDDDSDKDIVAGLFMNPMNMEMFKGLEMHGAYRMGTTNYILEETSYIGGLSYELPFLTLQGEYMSETDVWYTVDPLDPTLEVKNENTMMGYYAQASYRWNLNMPALHVVEPLVKYEFGDPNTDDVDPLIQATYDSQTRITGGINLHFAKLHQCKLMINYVMITDEEAPATTTLPVREDPNDNRIEVQLSLLF